MWQTEITCISERSVGWIKTKQNATRNLRLQHLCSTLIAISQIKKAYYSEWEATEAAKTHRYEAKKLQSGNNTQSYNFRQLYTISEGM